MKRLLPLFAFALLASSAQAAQSGPFTVTETGKSYARLRDAVLDMRGSTATIVVAPGTYRDCAVHQGGFLTIKAAEPGTVIFDGGTCEDKATLVLRGNGARIEGLIFQNLRVPDGNGAGIRLEIGPLEVVNSIFRNSQEGILTGNDPNADIVVRQSTFSGLGGCPESGCSHAIYAGEYRRLIVENCRFERGTGGHYVKSRAAGIKVTDSSFDDTQGHSSNYMIDLPGGATGTIAGNMFVQGPDKENYSAMIVVAAEGRVHSAAGLTITDNDARLGAGARGTTFIVDFTHEPLRISGNRLGAGIKPFETR